MVVLHGDLKHVLVDVEGGILAFFFHIEAAAAIVHDYRDSELISTRAQNLVEMLSGVHIQLNGAKFSNCFPVEVRIERLGLDSDLAAEVLRRELINITRDLRDLLTSVSREPVPGALQRNFDPGVVRLLRFCIQNRSLEKRSLDWIFRRSFI